jgi:hypothetical protein
MITETQHEVLRDLGKKIASAEAVIREHNARRFEYWWAVGRELEKSEYHTGKLRGQIAKQDMIDICQDLRLSTRELKTNPGSNSIKISGASTVLRARSLARQCPEKSDLDQVMRKYVTWGSYANYRPDRSKGTTHRKKSSNRGEMGRDMLTPANIRSQVWIPAVEAFMESVDESYEVARACLFGALRDLGPERLLDMMRGHYEAHPLLHDAGKVSA